MKKLLCAALVILCIALPLCSCQSGGNAAGRVLNEITSEKYAGRLIGTAGNQLAAEYLAGFLEKNKIQPYFDGTYFQPYKQTTADPNRQEPRLTIYFEDGSTQELAHGKDFVTNAAAEAIDAEISVVFDAEKAVGDVLPIIDEADLGLIPPAFAGKAVAIADDTYNLVTGSPLSKLNFTIIVNNALRDSLLEKKAKSAVLSCKYAAEVSELNNVVGIIPAPQKADKALVLTAHFDFIGHQGDFKYQGATDNASGVATLMSLAKRLQQSSAANPRDFDIIIAAVNSEETNEQLGIFEGSRNLAKTLSSVYPDIRNINIDSVGSKGAPVLAMGAVSSESEPFTETLRKNLSAQNILFSNESYGMGDHSSFTQKGYPSICVGEDAAAADSQHIHTTSNTVESVDIKELEHLAGIIAEFIMQPGANHFISAKEAFMTTGQSEPFSEEWNAEVLAERDKLLQGRKLKLNESIAFLFGNQLVQVGAYGDEKPLALLTQYYPKLKVPTEFMGYVLVDDIDLIARNIGRILATDSLPSGVTLNTITQVEPKVEDITGYGVTYKNSVETPGQFTINAYRHSERGYQLEMLSEFNELQALDGTLEGYTLLTGGKADKDKFYAVYFAADAWEYIVRLESDGAQYTRAEYEQFLSLHDLASLAKQISFE